MIRPKRIFGIVLALVVLSLSLIVWDKQQAIADWWKLRGYTPPTSVVSLADQDTMTAEAKHILYVNRPDLVTNSSTFRGDCTVAEQTIVLGCYHSDQDGIYVYVVNDKRLNGVEQVTIAHEMLHAAYGRLSKNEKTYIDGLLTNFYKNDLHDQRIIDTMKSYKKTEPNDVVNEMHSVFGTEVANLPKSLENYYSQYFTNRSAIVNFASEYEGEFTGRISKINAYDQQLSALNSQISTEEQSLSNQSNQLNIDRMQLNSLESSGQITQYNTRVPVFNHEVATYNQGVGKLQSDIASYNSLVNTRNAVANDLRSLDSSIDTRLTTQSAQ